MSFDNLGLSPDILSAIKDAGYLEPTPIQEKAIPQALTGRDILGCAQTGTGKTASFTLPMIEILANGRAKARMPRSLILTPTRELATQIAEHFEIYGKYHKLTTALLIGGVSADAQVKKLDRGVDVLIATPGRLLDHFERGRILMTDIKILVIDEADRMLDMGFIPDVRRIVELLPRIRQTLLFSATMGTEIRALADDFLINAKEVSVARSASIAQGVTHSMISVPKYPKEKRAALRKVMAGEDVQSALVFCNRKKDITILRNSLRRHGFEAEELHGDMAQHLRTETLAAYKAGNIKLLVCSDVAGRGLDIEGVSHVFNFDVPNNAESYVHRIGRTGRAGREGRAITLVTSEDSKYLDAIFRLIKVDVPILPLKDFGGPTAKPDSEEPRADAEDQQAAAPKESPAKEGGEKRRGRRSRSDKDSTTKRPARRSRDAESDRKRPKGSDTADKSRRDDSGDSDKVIGMGDHFPDFLREPRKPKRGGRR